MNMYDIIVIGIIAIFVILGIKKGFIMTILRFASWVASFIVARIFSPVLSGYFIQSEYFGKLVTTVRERLLDLQEKGLQNFTEQLKNAIAGESNGLIGDILLSGIQSGKLTEKINVIDFLSLSISHMLTRFACIIIVFFLVSAIFGLLLKMFKGLVKLPVIKQFDKLGGVVFGLLEGILISYVVLLIITLFNLGAVSGDLDKSYIAKHFVKFSLGDKIK